MSYSIHVQSKDGVSFFVENLQLEEAKVVEAELAKRFPAFDGYAITTYAIESTRVTTCTIESTMVPVCL